MQNNTPTIVVVDDSTSVRVFFERILAEMDIDLRAFGSTEESMQYLATEQPALLFLDIIMPVKDGLTFLQELRHMPLHETTQVVVISSKDYAQDRMTAKSLGVLEFVAKPMSADTIRKTVVKYLPSGNTNTATDE